MSTIINNIKTNPSSLPSLPSLKIPSDTSLLNDTPLIYVDHGDKKVFRVAKDLFSLIFFPYGLYRILHSGFGKLVIPSSWSLTSAGNLEFHQPSILQNYNDKLKADWKIRNLQVKMDNYVIDCAIIGKNENLSNGRWVLASHGNGEYYSDKLSSQNFPNFLNDLQANGLLFDYPGVRNSTGVERQLGLPVSDNYLCR